MKLIFTFAILVWWVEAIPNDYYENVELKNEWNMFKNKYYKAYDDLEELSRRHIWEENIKYIQEHNLRYDLGEHTYFLGINEFTDLTHEEFKSLYLSSKTPTERSSGIKYRIPMNIDTLPKVVDWVSKGYVTPVKNQGHCGSCWSFSTTGAIEGQYRRLNNTLISFSEQQLVDCSRPYGNHGCNGGLMNNAFEYVKRYGIERANDYPYKAKVGFCNYSAYKVVTKISSFVIINSGDENALAIAVATEGPISVAIDASHRNFQLYSGGVYNEINCSTRRLDHAVLAVGYGVDNGLNYWMVKNSWGKSWGKNGYVRMSKDRNNQCGIATMASYPII